MYRVGQQNNAVKGKYFYNIASHICLELLTITTTLLLFIRWHNHLKPEIKSGNWSADEDELIIELQRSFGNSWAKISKMLPGRSDNAVKNRFHLLNRFQAKNPSSKNIRKIARREKSSGNVCDTEKFTIRNNNEKEDQYTPALDVTDENSEQISLDATNVEYSPLTHIELQECAKYLMDDDFMGLDLTQSSSPFSFCIPNHYHSTPQQQYSMWTEIGTN